MMITMRSTFADYDVICGRGVGQGGVYLVGITNADLSWVQDSFWYDLR